MCNFCRLRNPTPIEVFMCYSVPPEVCSHSAEWAFCRQTSLVGKIPISRCNEQHRLTTEPSKIHGFAATQFSVSPLPLFTFPIFFPSLSPPHPFSPIAALTLSLQMNRSRDEKLSGILADRQCFTVI